MKAAPDVEKQIRRGHGYILAGIYQDLRRRKHMQERIRTPREQCLNAT